MNLDLLYHQWQATIERNFTNLKKWQAVGLALYSFGVVLAESSRVSKVAEALAYTSRITNMERRLRRWLANSRIDVQLCCYCWIAWVWRSIDVPRAILLVDETKLSDRLGIMMVSLAYENRAIPLAWCCYRANSAADYPEQGQVLLIWGLLAKVLEVLPADARPLVQMDRGLSHSSAMIKALDTLGLAYLLRVKSNSTFTSRRGKKSLLKNLIKPDEYHTCYGTLFRYSKRVTVTVHLIWELGQPEPWCLITNDPTIYGSGYAVRIWQEESFRDLKSGGWQWQDSYVLIPQRAERLVLVLAIAYAWMLTQGTFVAHAPAEVQREVFAGQRNPYSIFRSGLRFFKRMMHVKVQSIYVGLFFVPYFKPLPP
jgi:hypothetical protein